MTVANADFVKCATCANSSTCTRRSTRAKAPGTRRMTDLISAVGCFAFVLFVLIATFVPMLGRA